jgi:hypothetical protein
LEPTTFPRIPKSFQFLAFYSYLSWPIQASHFVLSMKKLFQGWDPFFAFQLILYLTISENTENHGFTLPEHLHDFFFSSTLSAG